MKIKTIYSEYRDTQLIKGSPFIFALVFWLTKATALLQRKSAWCNRIIHRLYKVVPKLEFVIKNNGGIFVVQGFDDSTTICADYFEKEIRNWLDTPLLKEVFVDIGANRGIYSIIAPTTHGYKFVHALEPNQEMYDVLKRNVALNSLLDKATCHKVAAGKGTAVAHFTVDPMHKGGGRIVTNTDEQTTSVTVEPLDLTLATVAPEEISFIKIDTEGYEFDVLSGMENILTKMTAGSCIMVETTERERMTATLSAYNFDHLKSSNHDHLFQKYA